MGVRFVILFENLWVLGSQKQFLILYSVSMRDSGLVEMNENENAKPESIGSFIHSLGERPMVFLDKYESAFAPGH